MHLFIYTSHLLVVAPSNPLYIIRFLKMFAILYLFALLLSCTCAKDARFLDEPLLTGSTTFVVTTITSTLVKQSPCYFTTGKAILGCRWKRGKEEEPYIVEPGVEEDIAPSPVFV